MGFEPMTSSLPRTCSTPEPQQQIGRSHQKVFLVCVGVSPLRLERVIGIEPTQPAWKAGALPLSYTRGVPQHKYRGDNRFRRIWSVSSPRICLSVSCLTGIKGLGGGSRI